MSNTKSQLRNLYKKRRHDFVRTTDVKEQARGLFENLKRCKLLMECSCVGGYIPINDEIDPGVFMQNCGKTLAVPILLEGRMEFVAYTVGMDVVEGQFKLLQPKSFEQRLIPDALLLPLLAFDRYGYRLGYGKGCYDKFLNETYSSENSPLTIGCAFDIQETDEIPHDSWDYAIDYVATPTRLIQCMR